MRQMRPFPGIALAALCLAFLAPFARAQELKCDPCNDHFGKVRIGSQIQRTLKLTNSGRKTLHIKGKAIKGAAFSLGNFPLPLTLKPGKSTALTLTFTPKVVGKNTGKITLTSDARNPKYVIELMGMGVAPDQPHLSISPASLDFGSVTLGSSASLTLTLSASQAAVTISGAASGSAEFTLPGLKLPLTVNAGQSAPVTVTFTPNASGTANAAITFTSNADNSPAAVPVTGTGATAGAHSADLTWNASEDAVIGYNVYRGGKKGGPYTQINGVLESSTDYTDTTVSGGTTYFYVVKAVNAYYQESGPSNEVKVVIPSP